MFFDFILAKKFLKGRMSDQFSFTVVNISNVYISEEIILTMSFFFIYIQGKYASAFYSLGLRKKTYSAVLTIVTLSSASWSRTYLALSCE